MAEITGDRDEVFNQKFLSYTARGFSPLEATRMLLSVEEVRDHQSAFNEEIN